MNCQRLSSKYETPQAGLKDKVEESEEKIDNLQKEVANLIGYLSNPPKNALLAVNKPTRGSNSNSACGIFNSYST